MLVVTTVALEKTRLVFEDARPQDKQQPSARKVGEYLCIP